MRSATALCLLAVCGLAAATTPLVENVAKPALETAVQSERITHRRRRAAGHNAGPHPGAALPEGPNPWALTPSAPASATPQALCRTC